MQFQEDKKWKKVKNKLFHEVKKEVEIYGEHTSL
ncbi:hypothetical protein C095_04475 [Fusobacterium necrophorum subsp. funduliforme B35]|uniref:Uncharacterized protein n=1 Tax=Fusobacterium necrophorum subsp. funduliforme B35 TaxID=1226633 RepID=A0A0B4E7E8_9FUSO|nr:hypothetical protein C095_04475 [Fusobacterium necrophorum subsp. funduliforme B35]